MRTEMQWGRRGVAGVAAALLLGLGLAGLSACGGSKSSSSGSGNVRLLNATSGYASLDLAVDAAAVNTGLAFGAVGSYASANSNGAATVISSTGSTAALSSVSRSLAKDGHFTLVAYGSSGALKTFVLSEDVAAPVAGLASLQVVNLAPDAGAVDVYLTGSTDTLDNATPLAANLGVANSLLPAPVTAGTYRLRVTGNGDKTDLRLDASGLVLGGAQVASLVLSESLGGVLVNSVLLVQQGKAAALTNTQARLRLVSAVSGAGSVTLNVAGTALVGGVSPNVGGYGQVLGSSGAPVLLAVNGKPVAVANLALSPGGDYTLLVWGDAAAPGVTLLTDDNRYPATITGAKLRLVNATSGAPVAFTLKADFSVVAQSVAQGQASALTNVLASSNMRLDVSSGSNAAVYSLTGATISGKGLYTMYMLGDSAAPVADLRKER